MKMTGDPSGTKTTETPSPADAVVETKKTAHTRHHRRSPLHKMHAVARALWDEEHEQVELKERMSHLGISGTTTKRPRDGDGDGADEQRRFRVRYTAEDDRRLAEEMAHTDRLLDEAARRGEPLSLPRPPPPWPEAEEEDGRPSAAEIRRLREFASGRFQPVSERFLREPFRIDADPEDVREGNRLASKLYATLRARAAANLEKYDRLMGLLDLHGNDDSTATTSLRPQPRCLKIRRAI
ncbi:hypothetical protein ACP4OV_000104 [Aristida adscensionis]